MHTDFPLSLADMALPSTDAASLATMLKEMAAARTHLNVELEDAARTPESILAAVTSYTTWVNMPAVEAEYLIGGLGALMSGEGPEGRFWFRDDRSVENQRIFAWYLASR